MCYQIKRIVWSLLIVNFLIGLNLLSAPVYAYNKITAKAKPSLNKILTEKIYSKTVFSLFGKAKYADDFAQLDYVNPNAPKGGVIKLAQIGTFDNFNRYGTRGVPEINSGSLYDSLFTNAEDDITTYYPLIATSISYSESYRWAEVNINPNARFQDGMPITAEDVEFTFHKFMTEGVPQYRTNNEGITVTLINPYRFRVILPKADREKLFSFVGNMMVIPKHFWKNHNLSEPLATPPIGSGPYFISDYKIGQYVVYQRNPDYWAIDLPINKGSYNFDQKRIQYYRDKNIALEAFKAGEYDFISESQPKSWYSQYHGNYFDSGDIVKQEKPIKTATDTQWLSFNLENELFKDINVRKALTLAFDFEWLNQSFYYNSYKRPSSFFENTIYAAKGKPTQAELKWLKPFESELSDDVFGGAYQLPKSDRSGFNRLNLLKATELLNLAGWVIKDGVLVNKKTNQPFKFELMTYMGEDIKYAIPFQKNLARLGIVMNIASLDYTQITRRLRHRDYDMMPTTYAAINHPSSSLAIFWGSEYLNSSYNRSGLHNQAIDSLIAEIKNNIDNNEQLIALGRALDRVLTHQYAMIPMWYRSNIYYAYWNKFGQPAIQPTYTIGLNTWWFDADKAAHLQKNQEH